MPDPPALPVLTADQEAALAALLAAPEPTYEPARPPPTHEPEWWRPPSGLRPRVPCSAHRTNGEPCRAWAIHGGRVCRTHGGAAPQVKAAAARRLAQAAILSRLYRMVPPPASPAGQAAFVLGGDAAQMAWADLVLGRDP
jgi:hypothetical protein